MTERFLPVSIEFADLPDGYEIIGSDTDEVSDPSEVRLRDPHGRVITWADLLAEGPK
ncbi:MAG TPA: hypothetical protein VI229_00350 [Burkholderiales bacterium]